MFYDRFALGNTLTADRFNGASGTVLCGDESFVLSDHSFDCIAERVRWLRR